jgi:uncharacterized membrane protein
MNATKDQIEQLKVDALYGKKKHFNAADRKRRARLWLNIPVVIINAVLGSLLMSILEESSPDVFKWLAATLAIVAAVLSAISIFLDLAKQVEGHRRVGNKYIAVAKQCQRLLAYQADGLISDSEMVKRLENLAESNDEANREAEAFHTNASDFKKAQRGMQDGEEAYLPTELGRTN